MSTTRGYCILCAFSSVYLHGPDFVHGSCTELVAAFIQNARPNRKMRSDLTPALQLQESAGETPIKNVEDGTGERKESEDDVVESLPTLSWRPDP